MKKIFIFLLALAVCPGVFSLDIESDAFKHKGYIPDRYTCDSKDLSPRLYWSSVPSSTKSFALICDDPDAPHTTWVHWLMIDIPAKTVELSEGIDLEGLKYSGVVFGRNDFGELGYRGPCPPAGKPHRYFFKLYALDTKLSLPEGFIKEDVEKAIKGHIVAEAKIIGKYQRKEKAKE